MAILALWVTFRSLVMCRSVVLDYSVSDCTLWTVITVVVDAGKPSTGPGQPQPGDLVGQIQAGVQLRPSANGSKIRSGTTLGTTLNQSPSLTGRFYRLLAY